MTEEHLQALYDSLFKQLRETTILQYRLEGAVEVIANLLKEAQAAENKPGDGEQEDEG